MGKASNDTHYYYPIYYGDEKLVSKNVSKRYGIIKKVLTLYGS